MTLAQVKTRYQRILEHSPVLSDRLRDALEGGVDLREELALMRALLGESLSTLGRVKGQTGQMQADLLFLVQSQIGQVTDLVDKQAKIEAKRTDQHIDLARVAVLLNALKQQLKQDLGRAGAVGYGPVVDAAFERVKAPTDDGATTKLLEAPVSYEVQFRPIDRIGKEGKPVLREETGGADQLLKSLPPEDPRVTELRKLQAELPAAVK